MYLNTYYSTPQAYQSIPIWHALKPCVFIAFNCIESNSGRNTTDCHWSFSYGLYRLEPRCILFFSFYCFAMH